MVWLQGESDGILHTSKEDYLHMLRTFWQDVRAELALDAFLIIRFAQFGDFPCFPIMLAQEEFCREEENAVLLTRITGTFTIENGLMQGETAPFHYTNKGYDLVGKTAGANAAKWVQGQPFSLEAECYDLLGTNL